MKVGIGLPAAMRGVGRAGIVDWAQRAERADDVICFPASADVSQVDRPRRRGAVTDDPALRPRRVRQG
jgi:hypothetical protein